MEIVVIYLVIEFAICILIKLFFQENLQECVVQIIMGVIKIRLDVNFNVIIQRRSMTWFIRLHLLKSGFQYYKNLYLIWHIDSNIWLSSNPCLLLEKLPKLKKSQKFRVTPLTFQVTRKNYDSVFEVANGWHRKFCF